MIELFINVDGSHCIKVQNDNLDCDALIFVFRKEGVSIDSTTGGVVNATREETYVDIEESLKSK